jgi:hypothetical protein
MNIFYEDQIISILLLFYINLQTLIIILLLSYLYKITNQYIIYILITNSLQIFIISLYYIKYFYLYTL